MSASMMVPLKHLARINGRSLREDVDPDTEIRYVDISAVGRGVLVEAPQQLRFGDAPSRARRLVAVGDTIVSTVRTYLRAVWPVADATDDLVVSTGFAVLTPRGVDPRYFSWWVRSDVFIEEVVARSVGVSYPAINAVELGELPVRVPALTEQRVIADYLDTETARIDALIAKKQRMIEALERRSAATLDDRLSGLFRPDVPLVPLRYVLRERDLRAGGSETVLSVYRDFGVIVKASREDNFNKTPDDLSNYKIVRSGDVVVNKMKAWQGSLGVSRHDGIVSGDYLVCESTRADVTSDYLHHLLRSPLLVGEYGVRSTGIRPSQWRLYWDDFAAIRIPVPSTSEQLELAEELGREYRLTRRLLDVVGLSMDLLREHREGLITAAVTGELAVPGVAA